MQHKFLKPLYYGLFFSFILLNTTIRPAYSSQPDYDDIFKNTTEFAELSGSMHFFNKICSANNEESIPIKKIIDLMTSKQTPKLKKETIEHFNHGYNIQVKKYKLSTECTPDIKKAYSQLMKEYIFYLMKINSLIKSQI